MREFPYGAVQLTGGPIKQHFDRIHAHYLALDNDRLLKVFRERAGLPAPGPDMGGWYDTNGFVPGLTLGQYISGLARLGAATGDKAAHEKVARLVSGFGEFIRRAESPYAGPNAQAQWAAYVMDKYVVGLVDAFQLSGVEEAKRLLPVTIDKCLPYISPVSRDRIGKKDPPYDETYVISENLFHVANITGDDKYRKLAVHYLLDKEWFDPLAAGIDVLPEKHAYSHTIALSSGAQAYLNLGDPKYLRALTNAWRFLEPQRFASGGWAPEEQFVHLGQGKLAESLKSSKAHFETPCGSFADMKLARYLIRLTGRPEYGDGLERTLYNTMLATRLPNSDGDYPYYSDYGAGAEKKYYHRKWPCCSGTLVQGVADYVLNAYFHDDDALMVNLFVASEVIWKRAGGAVAIVQDTDYPAADTVRLDRARARRWPFRGEAAHPGVGARRDAACQRQDPERRARCARHGNESLEGWRYDRPGRAAATAHAVHRRRKPEPRGTDARRDHVCRPQPVGRHWRAGHQPARLVVAALRIGTGLPRRGRGTRPGVRAVLHGRHRAVQHVLQNRVMSVRLRADALRRDNLPPAVLEAF